MYDLDDKHSTQPGFEPIISEFLATADSNEPSGQPTLQLGAQ